VRTYLVEPLPLVPQPHELHVEVKAPSCEGRHLAQLAEGVHRRWERWRCGWEAARGFAIAREPMHIC
jgi:hypothetical protein